MSETVASQKYEEAPRRVEFVILVATEDERPVVKEVLGLNRQSIEKGLSYDWEFIQRGTEQCAVALVALGDNQGELPAFAKTKEILNILNPKFVIVVGHAVGIRRDGFKAKSGIVFVPQYLQTGSFNNGTPNPLRAHRIVQPSDRLLEIAQRVVANSIKWHGSKSKHKVLIDREMISGPIRQDIEDNVLLKLVDSYPRFSAWEMESGGVAAAFRDDLERRGNPKYLVVKGFSDIKDFTSRMEGKKESQKEKEIRRKKDEEQRKRWRGPTTNAAANFVKDMIYDYCSQITSDTESPTPLTRLYPHDLPVTRNDQCAGVLHNVFPEHYSQIAKFNADREKREHGVYPGLVFTVCAFEPFELWEVLERSYRRTYDSAGELTPEQLKLWAHSEFPHFELFDTYVKEQERSCVRILLLRGNWLSRSQKKHWELFWMLNGEVDCWGVVRRSIRRVRFLTDYAVIGNRLLLDYYTDSCVLVISEFSGSGLGGELLELKDLFEKERNRGESEIFLDRRKLQQHVKTFDERQTTNHGSSALNQ